MARIYATAADLPAYEGGDTVPADQADVLLRLASGVVDRLATGRRYDTDAAGMPTDPDIVQAFKDATCLIAIEAHATGLTTPGASSEWGQVGIGNVTLGGRTMREGVQLIDGIPVPPLAVQALMGTGRVEVWVW